MTTDKRELIRVAKLLTNPKSKPTAMVVSTIATIEAKRFGPALTIMN